MVDELSKRIKELESKAAKADMFEEEFKPIIVKLFELTEQMQNLLQQLNPMFKVKSFSKPKIKGITNERAEQLYNELKNSDEQFTVDDIANKFNVAKTGGAYQISLLLRKMEGIQTRNEGRKIYFYYFKPKIGKDESEISPDFKIPTKISYMR